MIASLGEGREGGSREGDPMAWSAPAFAHIASIVNTHTGLSFPPSRRDVTEAAIRRAMAHSGATNLAGFAQRLATDPAALSSALHELTVGETYFFRDPAQWELIRREIVPTLLERHADGRGVRAWSAGCSSGEEAYTLGIVLRDAGCTDASVLGTDLDEHRLARARRAVYTKWSMRGVDDATLARLFRHAGQYYHLLPEFREGVRYRPLNLATPLSALGDELTQLDLILCRNVLIYFEPAVISAVFTRLVDALADGGWLMVAASDPQPSADLPLDVVLTDSGLLYRKRVTGAPAVAPHRMPSELAWSHVMPPVPATLVAPPPLITHRAPTPDVVPPAPTPVAPARARDVADGAWRAYRDVDYDRVVALAEGIVAQGHDVGATWVLLVRAHANRGDLARAARACALGTARHPDDAELHVIESALAAQQERFGAAAEAARRALYVDRTLAVAHLALGTALLRVGDVAAATRALRAAERLLEAIPPMDVVPASDGASAFDLLSAARAHLALLELRGSRAG